MNLKYPSLTIASLLAVQSLGAAAPVKTPLQQFAPAEVVLLESPFKQNMERNAAYLLSLNPDRFLHNTRQYCGMQPKAPAYGGWEERGIAGHSLGHYLSALSQQYAATGDKRFKAKIDYTVNEMAECQKRYGDGYVGALPPLELGAIRAIKQGNVELKGAWVPWYTQHKILAGLKDAWILGGNLKAKEVVLKLADWVDSLTAGLSPDQQQRMLNMEFGGMNEVLVELAQLSNNPKYLEVSRRFYHKAVMDPLAAGRDELPGKHANTQIPKIIGEAVHYETTGDENGRKIAENFWGLVTSKYLFAMGGNSDHEHFFPENRTPEHLSPETAESCNTYNMLKLTEHLMDWEPKVEYGDFYEKALYNHILASQEPEHGMFAYFISLKPGHFRTYSTPDNSFWCCVGTGMENHTRYGEAIYFHDANSLYVNLFIPSRLTWKSKGLTLSQTTKYPLSQDVDFKIESAPSTPIGLEVRCPSWATGPLTFTLNGQPFRVDASPGQFAKLQRTWRPGDTVRVTIPMGLRTEALHGSNNKVAVLYGPLLLAGDLGPAPRTPVYPLSGDHRTNNNAKTAQVPVFVLDNPSSLIQHLKPVPGQFAVFKSEGLAKPQEVTLRPFKDLFYNYDNVYWEIVPTSAWASQEASRTQIEQSRQALAARIVDEVNPGEQQPETDHAMKSERSQTGYFRDHSFRDAKDGGFFEYRVKIQPGVPNTLQCTYWGDDGGNRKFDILVNGKLLATQALLRNNPGQFFEVEYPLPAEMVSGAKSVVVRIQSSPGQVAGGLFGLRVLKP